MPHVHLSSVAITTGLGLLLSPVGLSQELTVGDAAPKLDITHWMKGEAVTSFTPGHVYILEFWATWCGPCVANMGHLSEIQEEYAERGVTVIGLSDEVLQTTVKFLFAPAGKNGEIQNDRTRYSLATDPDRSVHRAYFDAAGLSGIPAVFVIGKDARVEWIGHPKDLDPVVAAVVSGEWDREAHKDRIRAEQAASRAFREARDKLTRAIEEKKWEEALVAVDELVAAGHETYVPTKFGFLMSRMKQYERGYAYGREIMSQSWDTNAWQLYQLAWITSGAEKFPFDDEQRDLDFALKAIVRCVELEPRDYHTTMLASIRAQRGEYAEAAAAQRRALETLQAKRPKIEPHEMERFEAEIERFEAQLAEYEALAKRR